MATYNLTIFPEPQKRNRIKLITGQRFSRLLVIGFGGINVRTTMWHCLCDCGNTLTVRAGNLTSETTTSCGCLRTEILRKMTLKHGESIYATKSPEYDAYIHAQQRCNNPNSAMYKHYGARGITFKLTSIQEMLEDIGRRPSSKYSLDRIDVDGHYEKGNLRWATPVEQARNKTNNRIIDALDKSQTLSAWEQNSGIRRETIAYRLNRGWCNECAISIRPHQGICCHNGS